MLLLRRRRTFSGGIFLPDEIAAPADRPAERLAPAARLSVPLCAGAEPVVSTGDAVAAGQCIARGKAVHAPAAGRVVEIARVDTTEDTYARAVVIECDAAAAVPQASLPVQLAPTACRLEACGTGGTVTTPEAFLERIADAGVVDRDEDDADFGATLRNAMRQGVRHLIVNGLDAEPGLTAARRLLLDRGSDVLAGAASVARLLGVRRALLAVDRERRDVVRAVRPLLRGTPLRLAALWNKYPQASPRLLVKVSTGREVPVGASLLDAGAVVLDVATALAIDDAVTRSVPMTHCVVTVAGDAAERPGDYWIAAGTPLSHIVAQVGLRAPLDRVIAGGAMTGRTVSRLDVVTTRRTHALLFLGSPSHAPREPVACVRCGWCLDDCPMGLDPVSLFARAEQHHDERARGLFPQACIGCGVCSYVCPSHLPLMDGIMRLNYRLGGA